MKNKRLEKAKEKERIAYDHQKNMKDYIERMGTKTTKRDETRLRDLINTYYFWSGYLSSIEEDIKGMEPFPSLLL